MNEIILTLGSNKNRQNNIRKAQKLLRNLLPDIAFTKTIKTDAISASAIGSNMQLPFFYNCMAKATTHVSLTALQRQLKNIETAMGDSHESHRKGIIIIDIDLLAYGSQRLKTDDWQRPYIKKLSNRLFTRADSHSQTTEAPDLSQSQ